MAAEFWPVECPICEGRGQVLQQDDGRVFSIPCPECGGYGVLPDEEDEA